MAVDWTTVLAGVVPVLGAGGLVAMYKTWTERRRPASEANKLDSEAVALVLKPMTDMVLALIVPFKEQVASLSASHKKCEADHHECEKRFEALHTQAEEMTLRHNREISELRDTVKDLVAEIARMRPAA